MSEWTFATLKEYYDDRLEDMKESMRIALAAAALATSKAEIAHEKRLDSVNEFRQTLTDQQQTLARKTEVALMMTAIEKQLDALENNLNEKIDAIAKLQAEGKGIRVGWGLALGIIGVIVALIVMVTQL